MNKCLSALAVSAESIALVVNNDARYDEITRCFRILDGYPPADVIEEITNWVVLRGKFSTAIWTEYSCKVEGFDATSYYPEVELRKFSGVVPKLLKEFNKVHEGDIAKAYMRMVKDPTCNRVGGEDKVDLVTDSGSDVEK